MLHKTKLTITLLGMTLLLGGCMTKNDDSDNKGGNGTVNGKTNSLVSVQDYQGEGYELPNGEKNDKIAEKQKDTIDQAIKQFFLDTYKTEVKVHNIVGNKEGATVFVESVGEPHFHTFAIIPINTQDKVVPEGIWTQEGQVEASIRSGIYAMAFDKEIKELDSYLEKIVSKYPVTGLKEEAIQNVRSTGFTTPYYYITVLDEKFDAFYDEYLQNPKTTKEEWQNKVKLLNIDPEGYRITLQLFMKEKNQNPDQQILDILVSDLENMDTLSPGYYSVFLNDNTILADSADGTKDNTIKRAIPNYIIKP